MIACGGGGIPVAWHGDRLVGVEGVIDKDLASSLLARDMGAHKLIIVTSVEHAAIASAARSAMAGHRHSGQARQYLAGGEFPAGSMGPKIEAGIEFVERRAAKSALLPPPSTWRKRLKAGAARTSWRA